MAMLQAGFRKYAAVVAGMIPAGSRLFNFPTLDDMGSLRFASKAACNVVDLHWRPFESM